MKSLNAAQSLLFQLASTKTNTGASKMLSFSRFKFSGLMAAISSSIGFTGASAADLGSAYDPKSAGEATLTVWWFGNQEVPGIEDWMKESVAAYQKLYRNITVKSVLQSTDT